DSADMLVIAMDDEHQITELAHYVSANYPHVHIVARAVNRQHVYHLFAAGAKDIIRDTFDSATRAGRSALEALGTHPHEAQRKVDDFIEFDKYALRSVAEVYDPDIPWEENQPYIDRINEIIKQQDELLSGNTSAFGGKQKRGWIPPSADAAEDLQS
ncbi:MAG: potassium transporter, partial [Pseudomonadota bacterium]